MPPICTNVEWVTKKQETINPVLTQSILNKQQENSFKQMTQKALKCDK